MTDRGSDGEAAESDAFAALANPLRRDLLLALRGGPRTASELCSAVAVARSSASEHLRTLRLSGLVQVERRGREQVYHLDPRPLTEVGSWLNLMLTGWPRRLDEIKALAVRRQRG
jgi:DNA-binding transcriptional ArsR family regulator